MLGSVKAFSGFAVKDIAEAKSFYGDTLGLEVGEENGLLFLVIPESQNIFIYPKPDHQPAVFTILNFPVDDIDEAVDGLSKRGVEFERYEGFEQDDKGIARGPEGPAIAWFTDPSGNILSVLQPD
jgi:catechol 2,3-dioxygenase-like lactoylglutathione lyase family enzyme